MASNPTLVNGCIAIAAGGLFLRCVAVACKRRHTTKTKQTTFVVCPAFNPAEREALEPMLSRNIIKLQITDNHILSKAQSKSKSF